MKLIVYHEDPSVLIQMAQRLAAEFQARLVLLDPEENTAEPPLEAGPCHPPAVPESVPPSRES